MPRLGWNYTSTHSAVLQSLDINESFSEGVTTKWLSSWLLSATFWTSHRWTDFGNIEHRALPSHLQSNQWMLCLVFRASGVRLAQLLLIDPGWRTETPTTHRQLTKFPEDKAQETEVMSHQDSQLISLCIKQNITETFWCLSPRHNHHLSTRHVFLYSRRPPTTKSRLGALPDHGWKDWWAKLDMAMLGECVTWSSNSICDCGLARCDHSVRMMSSYFLVFRSIASWGEKLMFVKLVSVLAATSSARRLSKNWCLSDLTMSVLTLIVREQNVVRILFYSLFSSWYRETPR